jgi:hypothetical protein
MRELQKLEAEREYLKNNVEIMSRELSNRRKQLEPTQVQQNLKRLPP